MYTVQGTKNMLSKVHYAHQINERKSIADKKNIVVLHNYQGDSKLNHL